MGSKQLPYLLYLASHQILVFSIGLAVCEQIRSLKA